MIPVHPSSTVHSLDRIPALDGLRGLAVLIVLVFHTLPITDRSSSAITLWNTIAKSCWVGVDLFFVLSGFLITAVLLKSTGDSHYFRNFYTRRALRILPLYFTLLFGLIYVIPYLVPTTALPPLYHRLTDNQLWVWTFLQNFLQSRAPHELPGLGHFWTLAIEEQFYLVWPALVFWLSRRNLAILSIAVCLLEPAARWLCLHFGYSTLAVRELTYLRLDSLLFGALLCLLLRQTQAIATTLKLLSLAALAVLGYILYQNTFLPYESPAIDIAGYSAIAILCTGLIYLCLQDHLHSQRFFSAPLLRWFGHYSYGIYIFSIPTLLCFENFIAPRLHLHGAFIWPVVRLFCTGLLSTALAYLSWHLLESPFLNLKPRFLPAPPPPLAFAPGLTYLK